MDWGVRGVQLIPLASDYETMHRGGAYKCDTQVPLLHTMKAFSLGRTVL